MSTAVEQDTDEVQDERVSLDQDELARYLAKAATRGEEVEEEVEEAEEAARERGTRKPAEKEDEGDKGAPEEGTADEAEEEQEEGEEGREAFFDRGAFNARLAKLEASEDPEVKALATDARALSKQLLRDYTAKREADAGRAREAEHERDLMEARLTAHDRWLASLREDADAAELFLIDVADSNPALFEAAMERAQKVAEDPAERRRFEKEKKVAAGERKDREREAVRETEAHQQRTDHILGLMGEEMEALGLRSQSSADLVGEMVQAAILREGKDITDEQVRAAVRKAARSITSEREAAKKAADKQRQRDKQKETAERAKAGARKPKEQEEAPARPVTRGPQFEDDEDEREPDVYGIRAAFGLK